MKLEKAIGRTAKRIVRPVQQATGSTNFDILKHLSNLKKHVFGSKLYK